MNGTKSAPEGNRASGSRVGFETDALLHLIAEKYPRPLLALLEAIQNAVDSKAKKIEVTINLKNRSYVIEDNGCGMSVEEFGTQVEKIGRSKKAAVQGENYGRFGYGLVSFYGKFENYTFTSTPKATKGQAGWEGYHTHDIAKMIHEDDALFIPHMARRELAKGSIPWWNTQVIAMTPMMRLAKLLLTINDLADEVAKRYGEGIQKNGAELTITVIGPGSKRESRKVTGAPSYRGRALKAIRDTYKSCGLITGQLHFRNDDKGGTVYIRLGSGLNRIPIHPHVSGQLLTAGVKKDVIDDLSSGWFDGEISCDGLEMNVDRLHLTENDPMLDFAVWLESYHNDVLEAYTRELKEDAEERLDRSLLTQVAEALKGINLNYFSDLIGAITGGAAITKRQFGQEPDAAPTEPGTSQLPRERHSEPAGERQPREPKVPSNDPPTGQKGLFIDVIDDPGHARKFTPNQMGIRLCLDDLRGSSAHFEWEPEFSLLVINRRHPDYTACKGDPNRKRAYLETIVKVALPLQLVSDEIEGFSLMREALVRLLIHDIIGPKVDKPVRK